MKKTIAILSVITIIASCGGNETKSTDTSKSAETTATAAPSEPPTDPDAEKGLALIGKSDCFTCHKIMDKSVGPAYQLVAQRYKDKPDAVDSLAHKVIHGGSGNWGTVPMAAHPTISEADARLMVKYVLSLK